MVRKILYSVATVLVAASLIWAANDPWKSKPYDQWDDKDVQRIFNDSPWSKVVQIGSSSTNCSPAMPADTSTASPGQQSHGDGRRRPRTANPQFPRKLGGAIFNRRDPLRGSLGFVAERFAKLPYATLILKGQLKPEDARERDLAQPIDMYQVLVAGPNMKAFQSADENSIKKSAVLELKRTKEKLAPSDVKIEHKADGSIESVLFLFPRKPQTVSPRYRRMKKALSFPPP